MKTLEELKAKLAAAKEDTARLEGLHREAYDDFNAAYDEQRAALQFWEASHAKVKELEKQIADYPRELSGVELRMAVAKAAGWRVGKDDNTTMTPGGWCCCNDGDVCEFRPDERACDIAYAWASSPPKHIMLRICGTGEILVSVNNNLAFPKTPLEASRIYVEAKRKEHVE